MPQSPLSTWQRLYASSRIESNDVKKQKRNNQDCLQCHLRQAPPLDTPSKNDLDDCNHIDGFKMREWIETIQAKVDATETTLHDTNQPRSNLSDKTDHIQHNFHLIQKDAVFTGKSTSGEYDFRNQNIFVKNQNENISNHSTQSTHESSFHDVNNILQQFSNKLRICSINPIQDELQSQNHYDSINQKEKRYKSKQKSQKPSTNVSSNRISFGKKKKENRNINNNVLRRSTDSLKNNMRLDKEHKNNKECNFEQSMKAFHTNTIASSKIKTLKPYQSEDTSQKLEYNHHENKKGLYKKKVAEKFYKQRLLRKYFFALNEYKSLEILHINQILVQIESKKRFRLLRKVIRSWKYYVTKITKKEFMIVQNYKLRWLRATFSKWLDFLSHTRMRIQEIMVTYHWKIKSGVFFQWKKFIHEKKSEIAKINAMKLHIHNMKLNSKACQWHRYRHLSNCLLGWKKHVKEERNNRFLLERKENHKKRIEALLNRMTMENIHNKVKLNSNKNIVTTEKNHKSQFHILNDSTVLNEDIVDAEIIKMMEDAFEKKMKAYYDQLNTSDKRQNIIPTNNKENKKVILDHSANQKSTFNTKPKTAKNVIDSKTYDGKNTKKCPTLTTQASELKSTNSFATRNMEKRRLERSQRRKALQNRYLQIEKEKKEKALNETIEREREAHHQLQLRRQKQKQIEREKQDMIEISKKKRKSARIHFEHSLIARMYQSWATLIAMQRMKQKKAQLFCFEKIKRRSMACIQKYMIDGRKIREQRECMKKRTAERHYNKIISTRIIQNWNLHMKERKSIADFISKRDTYFLLANIVIQWRHKTEEIENTMRIQESRIRIIGHRLNTMWAMHKWIDFVHISRKEREINNLVAQKWTQVRRWL